MQKGFMPMKRTGRHYKLATTAVRCLQKVDFPPKTKKEHVLEHTMVSSLQAVSTVRPHLITQLDGDPIDKVTQTHLLGFKHRPDATIGRDGTALELKLVGGGQALREAIGQAMAYRISYRFVILVLIDRTPDKRIINLSSDPSTSGHRFLRGLADTSGIFSVIAPRRGAASKDRHVYDNVTFIS